jgi:rubrerythrin
MVEKEVFEETIGECLGLERAAQKAVEELDSKGLLKEEVKTKIMGMQKDASKHEEKLLQLIEMVTESEGFDSGSIETHAQETLEKTSEMMKTYLGEDPDGLDALEFLAIAEGGEVIHYEILSKLASKIKNKKFATGINAILRQENKHLQMCIRLAQKESLEK